jgi:hypothetical protein
MLVAAVIQTCRLELLQVPRKYVLASYTSLKEAMNQMLYLIAICIIKSNALKLENPTLTIIKESK